MKVVIYDNKYKQELTCMVCDYFEETNKNGYVGSIEVAEVFIDNCLSHNYYIYLVLDDDKIAGFMLLYVSNMYGFSKEYLVVDHMYILPEYRGSRATLWLFATIGKVMKDLQLPAVGTVYTDSSNKGNSEKVGGKVIAQITKVDIDDMTKKFKKYMKGLKCV